MSERKRKSTEGACCDTAGDKKPRTDALSLPKVPGLHAKHEPYPQPKIVSLEDWLKARRELNEEEKQLTRLRDALTKKRHELPWTKVPDYVFDYVDAEGKASKVKLSEAFGDKSELIVQHFMYPGADGKSPCPVCSSWSDGFNGLLPHIQQKAAFLVVAKQAAPDLAALTKRKQWQFRMLSSKDNTFNTDFCVEPTEEDKAAGKMSSYNFGAGAQFMIPQYPSISFFHLDKDKKTVYRTYTAQARALENFNVFWWLFDCLPQGRDGFMPKHKDQY